MKAPFIFAVTMLLAAAGWSSSSAPAVAASAQTTPRSAAGSVEHGKYLATHVAMCIECHSPRDESGTIIPGQEFTGASIPVEPLADWATRAPRNRGLLGYDDRQAMRLLTEGAIARDGGQLKPPMPRFRMTNEDAMDVIAYLRSLH
jgi:mono/diheme cytochrome c family protein